METAPRNLRRALTLPWLVFYGVGVTVGAGIFALIGEILTLSGDAAPMAFALASIVAGMAGLSYALLVSVFPKAGGEAVFVNRGLGQIPGRLAGFAIVTSGIISSAVIALACAGYTSSVFPVPSILVLIVVLASLTALAVWGVRASVAFAALITVFEVGTLLVVIFAGAPLLAHLPTADALAGLDRGWSGFLPVTSGALIAFFAFIGFEDIENLAEETVDPTRTVPRAILLTLGITAVLYVALALVAVGFPGRAAIAGSPAPLAVLFEAVTGLSGKPIAAMAAIAMVNGILVQIVMASRVLYGMAREGLIPAWFGRVHPERKTPLRATVVVAGAILILAMVFPLVRLAEASSSLTLTVFILVNLALFALGGQAEHGTLRRWRWWGLTGALISLLILVAQFSGNLLGAV